MGKIDKIDGDGTGGRKDEVVALFAAGTKIKTNGLGRITHGGEVNINIVKVGIGDGKLPELLRATLAPDSGFFGGGDTAGFEAAEVAFDSGLDEGGVGAIHADGAVTENGTIKSDFFTKPDG